MVSSRNEREHWNQKYRESSGSWGEPDPFLEYAFSGYIRPMFSTPGCALDLAGGAGRHTIWLAKQGWEVTLIDIAETGVEQARQKAGSLSTRVHFVVDDLTHFRAAKSRFDLVLVFYYLDRTIFPEIVKSIRPGGLLVYKTLTRAQMELRGGPRDPAYLLESGELLRLADGLEALHYREQVAERATAELVARKHAGTRK
jgi:tellurite methyltransferase